MSPVMRMQPQAFPPLNDEECWAAVVQRDPRLDGRFVYSVQTTGVYCRPSCSSRRAKRENVRFHHNCTEAEVMGFRACKRCTPDEGTLGQRHAHLVALACRKIESQESSPSLAELARIAGLSRYHFHRIFKAITGVTPRDYIAADRSKRVRSELRQAPSITAALYDAGYNSNGRFYATSKATLGMQPMQYRRGGVNATIRFAVGTCSLGAILVASTDEGVCAILIDDDPQVLVRQLQDQFPRATLIGADRAFEKTIATVIAFVDAPGLGLDLPLDVRGTAFQQRVWQALRQVPAGSTATYSAIARALGQPKAARAVALACAANPIAVAIPCHRVVRQDGDVSGYRWGIERKRALLQREQREKLEKRS